MITKLCLTLNVDVTLSCMTVVKSPWKALCTCTYTIKNSVLRSFVKSKHAYYCWHNLNLTRSSAIAEWPRDAICQLKFC